MPVHAHMPPGASRPNQAATKSLLSRRLRDAGLGQIKTMLEAMGKERGRAQGSGQARLAGP
jgi:hypothetical protein